MTKVQTSNPVQLLEKLWESSTLTQKKALLKARKLSSTWAQAKTIREVVDRGGGMIARDLLNLVKEHGRRNPKVKEVRFKK